MTVSDDDISILINEELLARRTKAMYLKNAGATLAAIAKENGVSIATVRKDLEIVRRDINNEQPMDVIARHRAVIFDIQRANYPAMMRGDKDAAATILRALEREAKLLGLDSPTRVLAAVSADDFANEAARLIDSIVNTDIDTLKELTHRDRALPTPTPEADYIECEATELDDAPDAEADAVGSAGGEPASVPGGDAAPGGSPVPDAGGAQERAADALPDNDDDWSNL